MRQEGLVGSIRLRSAHIIRHITRGSPVRKLLALIFVIILTLSCAQQEERVVRGGTPKSTTHSEKSKSSTERESLRRFGRDWKGRYCEKTIKKVYGLSDKQLEAAKQELKKKKPFLATKATQSPSSFPTPQTSE